MINKALAGILFLSMFFISFEIKNIRSVTLKRIVIDAGHGGKDPGCNGKTSREKDITLKIALQLGELIKTNMPDVEVTYTRKDDRFVELHDRATIANKINADLFISIHVNAGPEQFAGTQMRHHQRRTALRHGQGNRFPGHRQTGRSDRAR